MHGIFNGLPAESVERFFTNMIAFDASLPHTKTRISPITFQTFLARQGIVCLDVLGMYNQANEFWKKYLEVSPGILERVQGKYDMTIVEQQHPGWNTLIDLLNRVIDAEKFDGHPYYQMHYLAHVCFEAAKLDNDNKDKLYYMSIFHDCISTVLYDRFMPVSPATFAPILNYTDIRFNEGVTIAVAKSNMFISSHAGSSIDPETYDQARLRALMDVVEGTLNGIVKHKSTNAWMESLNRGLTSAGILNADYNSCELKQTMEDNGICCSKPFKWLNKIRSRHEKGHYNDNPDEAIDDLLDVYSAIKDGYNHYHLDQKGEKICEK